MTLPVPYFLAGRIFKNDGSSPLGDATVVAWASDGSGNTTSQTDGRYAINLQAFANSGDTIKVSGLYYGYKGKLDSPYDTTGYNVFKLSSPFPTTLDITTDYPAGAGTAAEWTTFQLPIGTATSWTWNSGQYNIDSSQRAYSETYPPNVTNWGWHVVSSSTVFYFPITGARSFRWISGSSTIS